MPNITELVRSEGFLYKTPTNLADPSGYGTELGYTVSGIDVYTNTEIFYSQNEENGNNTWRKFYLGNTPKVLTFLRNTNAAVMSFAFNGHNNGAGFKLMGGRSPGDDVTSDTDSVIFIPKNLLYPCVYIRYASVQMYPGTSIGFGHNKYTVYPVMIDCLPRESSLYLQVALIGSITL